MIIGCILCTRTGTYNAKIDERIKVGDPSKTVRGRTLLWIKGPGYRKRGCKRMVIRNFFDHYSAYASVGPAGSQPFALFYKDGFAKQIL